MPSLVHQFYAMGSDCAVHLYGGTAGDLELFADAAERETRRIEARYSRYRGESELSRINKVAATGGVIDIDAETVGLIAYAKACFAKSDSAFDITSVARSIPALREAGAGSLGLWHVWRRFA